MSNYSLYSTLLSLLCTICFFTLSINGSAQSCENDPEYDFSNPVLVSGTASQQGAVYRYTNVIPGVDALVTIEEISNNTTVFDFDDESSDANWFKPRTNVSGLNAGEEGYGQYLFEFVKAGTNTDTTLSAVNLLFVDIDGEPGFSETNLVDEPSSITFNDPTELSFVGVDPSDNTLSGGPVQAISGPGTIVGVSDANPEINFFTRYVDRSEFRIQFGIKSNQNNLTVTFGRQHGLIFTCPDNFNPITIDCGDCFDSGCPCYAPFLCDATLYQSVLVNGEIILYEVSSDPVSFVEVANLTQNGGVPNNFNALAYNPQDNFLYGW